METLQKYGLLLIVLPLLLLSCDEQSSPTQKSESDTLFTEMPSDSTGVNFINSIKNESDFNIFKYRNFYNGGGVAIGDINNDGLADIYLTANMGKNKLFLNKGDFKFEDISASAGIEGNKPWSTGVTMADVNADGLLDIYVSNAGNLEEDSHDNDLYINNGDLTFTEKAKEYNLATSGFSTQASFFDYDKDGDLDVYILNNSNVPVSSLGNKGQRDKRAQNWESVGSQFRGVGDLLMRNDGGIFTDVSEEAGIYGSLIGFGLGVVVTDINQDLWPDIYISNDFFERDYLYINNQDGTFTEEIKEWTSHLSLSAMGIDISDINNDGLQDIFITDMLPENEQRVKSVMEFDGYNVYKRKQRNDFYQQFIQNTLQINNGNGSFSETAYHSGVNATDWSWSGLVFDMDNDGFRDIYVTNGINHDLTDLDFVDFFADKLMRSQATGKTHPVDSIINKMPVKPLANYAYHNQKDITFKNKSKDWGLATPSMSNGAAHADLDNDGDLDIVVNNVNMPSFIYRNNTKVDKDHNYIKLTFKGGDKNKFAVGTTVRLYHNNLSVLQELIPSRGFQSSMDHDMTIGLGSSTTIDSLRVIWPDDKTQLFTKVKANQTLNLSIIDASETYVPVKKNKPTLLKEITNPTLIAHKENNYSDFDFEGLIAKKLSQEGPAIAIGDIDNDGNDDIFIGGAKGQTSMLYIHKGKGNLIPSSKITFEKAALFEDTAATFVDVNNDGFLDLIVSTGGGQVDAEAYYISRLYINNGNGTFKDARSLPSAHQSASVIAPNDIDGDGDIDLFIGSRSVAGVYGINPPHAILINDGKGNFTKDNLLSKQLNPAGMVTDALWIDLDADNNKELITVSDWGTPTAFNITSESIKVIDTGLSSYAGWWNAIQSADFDNDGDLDLILGNDGTNVHYKPGSDGPLKMFITDFDGNGTIEQITTYSEGGKDFPIHQKSEITSQIVSLKKKNLKASDYAKRSIDELFPKDILANAIIKEVNTAETVIAINEGNGNFTIKALPTRVQLSCVCGITCTDVNNDGNLDILMGGNNFEFKPQYSQLDAGYAHVLLGDGKANFEWQDYTDTGFFVREEMKHLESFKDAQGNIFLVSAINDGKPRIFTANK
ncbi:VCBS repeat-containing protein [Dokdonia sp. PRO95]|uniref:VCBS repeat-containing protein n=1 Tax=Dokdonia sp. PRO95 TaxID=1239415 RepID=UPI0005512EBB|nr:VCBS repeat-containing protein [Dokdonia sp. PRO95]